MLKWSVSQQHRLSESTENITMRTPRLSPTKRRKRRATIANKENIITSTPMALPVQQKCRLSPLVLAPLTDILNITPESVARSTERPTERTMPQQYASTLPKFEEEYSPSTLLPGRVLAMRGLLPDTYLGNPRYFTTPEVPCRTKGFATPKPLPKKRKLDMEFADTEKATTPLPPSKIDLTSTEMGDHTLDKLIDAILESACKDKKKKPRKSFNLRRRTLMKATEESVDAVLSPSYARADDPASDLSFLRVEAVDEMIECERTFQNPVKKLKTESSDCGKYFEIGLALPSIYV